MEAVEILEVRSWDVHNVVDPSTVDELINLPCRDSFYGPFLVKLGMVDWDLPGDQGIKVKHQTPLKYQVPAVF